MSQIEYSVVLFGGGSVGKSCLLIQYLQGRFVAEYDPTVAESYSKMMVFENDPISIKLFDTAGQGEFQKLQENHFFTSEGFLLLFSLTSNSSFLEIVNIHKRILKFRVSPPCILVGNKCDLVDDRRVSLEEAENFAKKYNISYFETSANTGKSVKPCFEKMLKLIKVLKENGGIQKDLKKKVKAKKDKKKGKIDSGCCIIV
ncbi:ras-like protein [Anaeramoeba flamelloides]|uniref:Ras-like protein n=1 Tax=Anaeramoeba flamelloides TaxID=1746091 RepID=A0ABQ8Z6Q3_9EUKA|nr:ras-like protein [Anaeramoeba flamelloides]